MKRTEINFAGMNFRGTTNFSDLKSRRDVQDLGIGKGLRCTFEKGELIFFPSEEEAKFRIGVFTDSNTNKKTPTIELWVYTSSQKWLLLPISMLRRVPSRREDLLAFKENNEFGCQLAASGICDLEMCQMLFGKTLVVSDRIDALTPQFKFENGKYEVKKDDDGKIVYDKERFTYCYKVEEYIE